MLVKFGMIITDGRNKLGGHVLSKNRGGSYARTKVTPINPQSSYQSNVRQRFTTLSQAWRGLTQDQRDAWNGAVANFQRTNIFGDLKSPSGFNLYQRLNNVLLSTSSATINFPPLPAAVPDCHIAGLLVTVATPSVSILMNETVPADTKIKVFATPPLSPGKSFVKNMFRLIAILDSAETSPYDALAEYTAKYGSVGEIGQRITFKTLAVNTTTGQEGTPAEYFVITSV